MNIETVKMFTFVVVVAGARYGGQIPATSFEEAQALVPSGAIFGERVETRPVGQICSVCAGKMAIAEPVPVPIDDEWDEEFV